MSSVRRSDRRRRIEPSLTSAVAALLAFGLAGCVTEPPGDESAAGEPVFGARDAAPPGPAVEDAFEGAVVLDAAPATVADVADPSVTPPDAASAPPADATSGGQVADAADPAVDGSDPPPPADASVDAVTPDAAPDLAPPDAAAEAPPDALPDAAPPGPDAAAACAGDLDCPFDAFCVEGVCHTGGLACGDVADCPRGDICRLGFCAPGAAACAADGDCVAGEICETGACRPAQCLSDLECLAPAVCAEGRCGVPGAVEACNGADDDGDGDVDEGATCPEPQLCRRGECVAPACVEGETRLVAGATPQDGRLEICVRGVWGTVCLAGFDAHAARIACRTAGLPEASPAFGGAPGGADGRPIWVAGLHCAGGEASLLDCPVAEALGMGCTHGHDVGLTCPDGPPPEVCNGLDDDLNGAVDDGSLCDATESCVDGACVAQSDEVCNGRDDDLNGRVDEGVLCAAGDACLDGVCRLTPCDEGRIRLVGGPSPDSGRVEICHGGAWGTVCDDAWDNGDAQVVCRQLGFPFEQAVAQGQAAHGEGVGEIWLDDLACGGAEENLAQCGNLGWGVHNCSHSEDAGVMCSPVVAGGCDEGTLRLVGGNGPTSGRVELCHAGLWGTVCDDGWDAADAQVVCRQLGLNPDGAVAQSFAFFGQGIGQIWLDDVGCAGGEATLVDCGHPALGQHNCSHGEDAAVECGP